LPIFSQHLVLGILILALTSLLSSAHAAEKYCGHWPAWNKFNKIFISDAGRVIDRSLPEHITTSEGQAYAIMFALIANDRAAFDLILQWTEKNLAQGDLNKQLPAWKWGARTDGSWGVIDGNSASDADLWLAYALHEAARLWQEPTYAMRANSLAVRILQEETADVPGLGLALLPGRYGFHPDPNSPENKTWRFNPSYFPIQVLRRFANLYPNSKWHKILSSSLQIITQPSLRGIASDWVVYSVEHGLQAEKMSTVNAMGFDAIRVYLWAGMLPHNDEASLILLKNLAPLGHLISTSNLPPKKSPEKSPVINLPAGFSAALLPFLKSVKLSNALQTQYRRVVALSPLDRADNYYDQVLTLFGLGWLEGRYQFEAQGQLKPRWSCK
jgi:endoglucanase